MSALEKEHVCETERGWIPTTWGGPVATISVFKLYLAVWVHFVVY